MTTHDITWNVFLSSQRVHKKREGGGEGRGGGGVMHCDHGSYIGVSNSLQIMINVSLEDFKPFSMQH